jgi:hypothetical protein
VLIEDDPVAEILSFHTSDENLGSNAVALEYKLEDDSMSNNVC